jgi:hypothetical protein
VTLDRVYYQWHLANSKKWQRHSDSLLSAQSLLSERSDIRSASYVSANVRGLAFYINDSISVLSSHAKELAMDATYGTNNKGMELFAVLAEFDGAGVPLAYCFVDVFEDNHKNKRNAEHSLPVFATTERFWIQSNFFRDRQGPSGDLCDWPDLAKCYNPAVLLACGAGGPCKTWDFKGN